MYFSVNIKGLGTRLGGTLLEPQAGTLLSPWFWNHRDFDLFPCWNYVNISGLKNHRAWVLLVSKPVYESSPNFLQNAKASSNLCNLSNYRKSKLELTFSMPSWILPATPFSTWKWLSDHVQFVGSHLVDTLMFSPQTITTVDHYKIISIGKALRLERDEFCFKFHSNVRSAFVVRANWRL